MNIIEKTENSIKLKAVDDILYFEGAFETIENSNLLNAFLNEVKKQLPEEITIDFVGVTFMNSSIIKVLVRFLIQASKNSKIYLRMNPASNWQEVSLRVLTKLNPNKIEIIIR